MVRVEARPGDADSSAVLPNDTNQNGTASSDFLKT